MTTIKSYTDLEQSHKLAEILPLESADMTYLSEESLVPKVNYNGMVFFNSEKEKPSTIIPCWSLAALLGVLPNMISRYFKILGWCYSEWDCAYMDEDGEIKYNSIADNPVDACVAMVEKLNELKLL